MQSSWSARHQACITALIHKAFWARCSASSWSSIHAYMHTYICMRVKAVSSWSSIHAFMHTYICMRVKAETSVQVCVMKRRGCVCLATHTYYYYIPCALPAQPHAHTTKPRELCLYKLIYAQTSPHNLLSACATSCTYNKAT